ncbi:hypothetical protein BGZ63DRAFT_391009 [Mariannaea sp. PMI_226]|nr:hypothetical protein BGZ63DRAFT_391009 [Mariannaea sp. PMI_226]
MKASSRDATFTFVSYEGSKLPENPDVRYLIRHRAMRHTATIRKRAGGYGRHNLGQLPPGLLEAEGSNEDPKAVKMSDASDFLLDIHQDENMQRTLAAGKTQKGIRKPYRRRGGSPSLAVAPVAPMPQNYILLNLASPFTALHLGVSTLSYFMSDSASISKVLSRMPQNLENRRILSFIPSRYGRVSSITHATDCVIARLELVVRTGSIYSTEGDTSVLTLYSKALRSLQEAIDDEDTRMMPETLCAAELLGIYELLSGTSQTERWIQHAGGAARLIELYGPERFKTDFELSLFMSHTGPIITEAFLNGRPCFLDQECWQLVIRDAIRNDPMMLPERAQVVMELWARLGKLPNIFNEAEGLILYPQLAAPGARERLITSLLRERDHLKSWVKLAQKYLHDTEMNGNRHSDYEASPFAGWNNIDTTALRSPIACRILQGTYVLCNLVKTRTLFALSPSRFPELEATCQTLAQDALSMAEEAAHCENEILIGGLFMSEVSWMANAVIATKDIWNQNSGPRRNVDRADKGTIESWKFEAWCRAMGRRHISKC